MRAIDATLTPDVLSDRRGMATLTAKWQPSSRDQLERALSEAAQRAGFVPSTRIWCEFLKYAGDLLCGAPKTGNHNGSHRNRKGTKKNGRPAATA